MKFTVLLEEEKENLILKSKNTWHDYFREREEILFGLEMMMLFYKDVLNYLLNKENIIFNKYKEDIIKVASKNDIIKIIKKVKIIDVLKNKVRDNTNINLLIDKLILDIAEVE